MEYSDRSREPAEGPSGGNAFQAGERASTKSQGQKKPTPVRKRERRRSGAWGRGWEMSEVRRGVQGCFHSVG